ncbi:MAG: peptide chain release factor N(5)-glutamine methyltransferase [Legionella sp.]|nr:peptide chain release factor N(5)-glutamine methyltransferase [Legionella sp.]
MIDIGQALKQACFLIGSPIEAEILLSWILKKNRAYLFSHPEALLDHLQWENYLLSLHQRAEGKPIAYIMGIREFWSLSLQVNQHTLIPRHETEQLVELALEFIPNGKDIQVLDLGTGSGAIALALATERPNWNIDACDISAEALKIAKANAKTHQINNVSFYQSDWFKKIPCKRYHAILTNPPYLSEKDPHLSQGDLSYEPKIALKSGQDGLCDLHYIIAHSIHFLRANGLLLLEHGYQQEQAISTILNKTGFQNRHCWQDFQGHDRISGGWFPGP